MAVVFDRPLELAQLIIPDSFLAFPYGFLQKRFDLFPGRLLTIKQLLPVMRLWVQIVMKYVISLSPLQTVESLVR